ncbi:4'-phosphopantetheinyl transferase superfamily protein [Alteromonas sp. C1M14]|uniref:4'-phosphopantetheinyl transferase family protein n=1 Tax=Alteromonas sp. C1M14 TaxID=2841567 RepID=UPI001C085A9B|nr:4'-phosphopantetheinyl transferase superfamily protein [Alteromonas sp. C1M14]MBU2979673.1 4'-phosphopantetheinyl transferase superfamily protein [Alteromonas sp. C1M14]
MNWLSPQEHEQGLQRRHPNKRTEFIFSRALIKKQLGMTQHQASTSTLKLEKHFLVCTTLPDTAISLSHSHGLLAFCIYDPNRFHIGVDVELQKPRQNFADLSGVFHESECSDESDLFYLRWTAKEALAKALSLPLTQMLPLPVAEVLSKHGVSLSSGLFGNHRWSVAMPADSFNEIRIHSLTLPE